jgi:hypothetical protein
MVGGRPRFIALPLVWRCGPVGQVEVVVDFVGQLFDINPYVCGRVWRHDNVRLHARYRCRQDRGESVQ